MLNHPRLADGFLGASCRFRCTELELDVCVSKKPTSYSIWKALKMSKHKFFDPEFADAIMDVRVSTLEEESQVQRKTFSFIACIIAIVIGVFAGINVAQHEKMEARIVVLEQEN